MQHMADTRLLACRLGPRPNAETSSSGDKATRLTRAVASNSAGCNERVASAIHEKEHAVYSARIATSLIQLGTNFAVEPTLIKLSSYAQRDPASPGFQALLPLTKYATTFR